MVHELVEEAITAMSARRELFSGEQQYVDDFAIAVRNGYDAGVRCSSSEVVGELQEAIAVLKPVSFPQPAPRSLRAAGFVCGVIDEHLVELHADEEFRRLLTEGVSKAVAALREWKELEGLFDSLFKEALKEY